MSDDLISKEMFSEENANKVRASSAEIVVHGTKEKPYYEIEYFDIVNKENKSEHSHNHIIGDLISRKAAVELVIAEYDKFQANGGSHSGRYELDKVIKMLQNMPTAFDKENVIEELKEEGCIIDNDAGNRAVEIVEKGGIG